ncbi:MAG: methylhydantoinase [Firmicutes bacterium]|nr:methylhydantoinase [Bacillota bacterium]
MDQRFRLGFDIGGTFTDFVLLDPEDGSIHIHKCLTTYPDPSVGSLAGTRELLAGSGLTMANLATTVHGTTLVTNAIIERRGARLALLTTEGFRDILAMGKEQRYDVYDLFLAFPEPLVGRRWRREIRERMDAEGNVLTPLDPEQVRSVVAELVAEGVESLAVCFLHAYKNPAHERLVKELVRREFPGLSVSISSEVVPEIREYERTVTCAANAYVQPLVDSYLGRLEGALDSDGYAGRFYLMQSSGGTASPAMAREFPVRLLESGPAGGALVAAFYGQLINRESLLSFDMGGTTAKACLIQNGKPDVAPFLEAGRVHRFKRGSGLPIKAPVIDLIEIGAGGGSIARIDELGLLKVGPESAASQPGPACYGLGGTEPSVTDANLVLGYLNPGYFLGGRMSLDAEAAREAIGRVARPLGLSVTEAAWGIYQIVSENMAAAARVHIVEKGQDPRRFDMVAFGGAGPAHACQVARILGQSEVIAPLAAGALSALGFLVAPISFDFAVSNPMTLDHMNWDSLNAVFADMEERGRAMLVEAGVSPDEVVITRTADMRLVGQVHEISVPLPGGNLGPGHLPELQQAFRTEYVRLYSSLPENIAVQALSWRVVAAGPKPQIRLKTGVQAPGVSPLKGHRPAYFPGLGYVETPVYERYALAPATAIDGPAIFEERESTCIVGPGDQATVDRYLNLVIRINRGGGVNA